MANDAQPDRAGNGQRRWIPALIGERYRVERELGSGAAAVTVLAIDQTLGRRVAVKLLKPESDPDQEFPRRFSREARAAASVNHQNVVSVYDVGQDGDLLYLVMQFVDGTDLKRVIDRDGALPWRRAVEIARDVLSGLGAIHATGIVHRDIKPQNVLIGDDGSVKVTDFGVAHAELDSGLTAAGMTVGTAAYMAPEQGQGKPVTPSADVYAVGVMLYEMVSGRVPFTAPTSVGVMLAHIQQQAPPPRAPSGIERLPEGLVAAIRQAMSKEPDSRFRGAAAMRSALERPESWREPGSVTDSSDQTGRTQIVPSMQRPQRPVRSGSRQSSQPSTAAPPSQRTATPAQSGGGFGTFIVAMLIVLALGLVATAGALWYLEQQEEDNDSSQVFPAEVIEQVIDTPTSTTAATQPATDIPTPDDGDEPAFIEPFDTAVPLPTDPPVATETVIAPPTEAATAPPTLAPAPTSTPIAPSTEPIEGGIIVPIESPTAPSDG